MYYITMSQNPNIFSQIRQEQQDFMFNYISVVQGYPFNQYQTIKRIALYLSSKYEDGSLYLGREKIFYNVVIPPCEVAMRMLNLDTKDIKLWPMNPKSQFSTYLLEKELKLWLKTSKMGKILNQIAEEAPRYGTVVLEKTKDGAEVVDLRRLILDPTVETITKSRFVTTIHYMTPNELQQTGWDNVDLAIERFGDTNASPAYEDNQGNVNLMKSTPYIKVHKRFGEVPTWWVDDSAKPGTKSGDKLVRSLFIVAGAETEQLNEEGKSVADLGLVLFKSVWRKEWPYKDFHYIKVKGRYLGMGIVEMLFDTQTRINELKNQKRVSMEISSMHIFQGPQSMVRNIYSDLQSGDYLVKKEGSEGMTPVANEERNLPAFKDEEQSYMAQVDSLSFAYEAVRGDVDTQATLGQTQIAVSQGTSVYGFKKQNFSLFLQEYFNDLVLEQLMKDLTPEHIMRFTGSAQELMKLDEAAAELYANDHIKQLILDGSLVNLEDQQALIDKAKAEYQKLGDSRFLKIKQNFYKDAQFEFDFIITNEQADPIKLATSLQALIAEYDPQKMQDPVYALFIGKQADSIGISQAELDLAALKSTQHQQKVAEIQAAQPQQPGAVKSPIQPLANQPQS
jgi:hypothetical protein